MGMSTGEITKRKRKPRAKTIGTPVLTRLQPDFLGKLDEWRDRQEDQPGRPEAIRRLLESALKRGK
jgi:hypothetical protein